jgi:arylsulfatase A-like enzyme
MKKTSRRILIITTLGILLGAGLFAAATALLQKYKWEINIFLYGKKEAKKQEFIYHSQGTLQKAFAPSSPDSPNVILISLDTLRAQSMGCYGFKKETTPFLDQFAREGVLFENMCSASTSTPPSHMSIMTGLYLSVHGVLNQEVLDRGITTLPEMFSAADYATGAVTENGFLVRQMGFGRGFDDYYEIKDVLLFDKLLLAGGFARDVFERGKSWIREKSAQKFFLFLHTYEVHDPYLPPPPYDTMFLDTPDDYREHLKKFRQHLGRIDTRQFPPEFIRAQYEGEIRYVDALVKDLIAFIREQGLAEKTLIIITSDHGEQLFERNNIVGHGYYTFDTESHVPFIMWMPGTIPAGVRIPHQASNVDILPTVAEFLHLEVKGSVQGMSLLPLLRTPNARDHRHVFCEAVNQTCIRTLRYKFIDTNELYLYEHDPAEALNRADTHRELCNDAAERLRAFRAGCQSLKAEKGLLKPGETVDLDEKDINKLKALGYIE